MNKSGGNVVVAGLCLVGFLVEFFSTFLFNAPPTITNPIPTSIFGRSSYLTIQTNFLNSIYFALYVWFCFFGGERVKTLLVRLLPLSFALGCFITIGYYGLDHFNEHNVVLKNSLVPSYPYIWVGSHLEHCFALPAVFLHATTYPADKFGVTPTNSDVLMIAGSFIVYYAIFIELNHTLTGGWVYPVLDDVFKAGGEFAKNALLAGICVVSLLFAFIGKTIANFGSVKKNSRYEQ